MDIIPQQPDTRPNWIYICILCAFGAALYLMNLGAWDLWPSDEPRFGQIEKEMLRSGNWLVPHVNNRVYTDKPPLFFWTGGLFALMNGGQVESWTTRLPSALSGIGALLITFFIGLRLFNAPAALLGALATGITSQFIDQARTAQTDMIMTVFALGAIAAFTSAWFGSLKPIPGAILFGVCSGMAVLGKGPVGMIIPIGSVALFFAMGREWKRVRWSAVLVAPVFSLAVILVWLLPMYAGIDKSASKDLLWDQNITRFLDASGHLQPPWFFLKQLPLTFLPMTIFFPFAAMFLWREGRGENHLSRQHLFLLSWSAFTLIFFSCSKGKRDQYILPLFPALGLLIGQWLDQMRREDPQAHPACTTAIRILACLYIVIALILAAAGSRILTIVESRIEGGGIPADWFSFPLIALGIALAGAGDVDWNMEKEMARDLCRAYNEHDDFLGDRILFCLPSP